MARAPRPGTTRKDARVALKITFNDQEYVLDFGDLNSLDDIAARKETGMPISPYLNEDHFSLDSMAILTWVAIRKTNQPTLKFREFVKSFPSMMELPDWLDEGRLSIEAIEGDDAENVEIEGGVGADPLGPGDDFHM